MKVSEFDRLTKSLISPYLERDHGFSFSRGVYVRELPGNVRHLVMFDIEPRTGTTFRVIMGFNSSLISGQLCSSTAGAFGVKYLNASGMSDVPFNFMCFNKEAAIKSLTRAKEMLEEGALSWMSSIDTLEKLADMAEEQYPFIKGRLYLAAGCATKAKQYFSAHLSYLYKQKESEEINQAIRDTQDMLRKCV